MPQFVRLRQRAQEVVNAFKFDLLEVNVFELVKSGKAQSAKPSRHGQKPSHALSGGVLCSESDSPSFLLDSFFRAEAEALWVSSFLLF